MKQSVILSEARARVATPDMWCKFKLIEGNRRCLLGAMGDDDYFSIHWILSTDIVQPALETLYNSIKTLGFYRPIVNLSYVVQPYTVGIAEFNNHPDTTHTDILAVLNHAIEQAEAKELWVELNQPSASNSVQEEEVVLS